MTLSGEHREPSPLEALRAIARAIGEALGNMIENSNRNTSLKIGRRRQEGHLRGQTALPLSDGVGAVARSVQQQEQGAETPARVVVQKPGAEALHRGRRKIITQPMRHWRLV